MSGWRLSPLSSPRPRKGPGRLVAVAWLVTSATDIANGRLPVLSLCVSVAGLRDDEDFPAHVYPSSLPPVTSPVVVAVDLPIPPDYRVRPFLSASIPGVTVVLPELDDPVSYPRPDAKLPPVERFFVDTSEPVDGWLMVGQHWTSWLATLVLYWLVLLGASHRVVESIRRTWHRRFCPYRDC